MIIYIDNILVDLDDATNVTIYDSEAVVVWHNPFDVCRSLVALVWRQRFGNIRPPLITASSCVSESPGAPGPSARVGPQ